MSFADASHNGRTSSLRRSFLKTSVLRSILLGSLIGTAAIDVPAVLAEQQTATSPLQSAASDTPRAVKMIGSFARGQSCEEQVWPYIESRCLTRAKPSVSSTNDVQTPRVEYPGGSAAPTVRQGELEARVATTHLSLPKTPGLLRDRTLSETDGMGVQGRSFSVEAQTGGRVERSKVAEPRRRTSRKVHRHRRGSSVAFFPFRF